MSNPLKGLGPSSEELKPLQKLEILKFIKVCLLTSY